LFDARAPRVKRVAYYARVPDRLSVSVARIRASVFADLAPKIEAFTRAGGKLVPLHIGDVHLAPPEPARFDHGRAFEPALYGYGAITGTPALREACAARVRATGRAFASVDAQRHVLLGSGATHAIFCAARALFDPGDEVLLASPYWPLAHGILHAAGAVPVEVPLTQRLYAEPDLDAGDIFLAAMTPRTRGIYLITPNNPDGKVLARAHLEQIARVARERDLWVIADEVYADYTYAGEHVSIAALDGMAERTVTAYSFSKSHALAGARVGFVVAPENVTLAAQRVSTHTIFNVPVVTQRAALAAMGAGEEWVDRARAQHRAARDAAAQALAGANVTFAMAEGGSYLFLDFRDLLAGRPLKTLLERAIDHGVLLAPGDACGAGFERHARMCFTSAPIPVLLEGIAALRRAMEEIA
jgi:aspartate/methionine/tyrosine aminotransferase